MADRTYGTYYRVAWSQDWLNKNPWSLSGNKLPYVGWTTERQSAAVFVGMITFGPIAFIYVTLVKV
ncbi:MAG: hypothetical protein KJP02_04485 [Octadecabacter sp.]|nr:hypothetical protein [Octadecabacter sp.]